MRRHNFNCVLDKTNNYISYDSIKTTEHIKDIAETEGTVRSIEINTMGLLSNGGVSSALIYFVPRVVQR